MKRAFSLPILLRTDPKIFPFDLSLLNNCLNTLKIEDDSVLIVYNQGPLSKDIIEGILKPLKINYEIIGGGINVGIPVARQKVFEYVWEHYPEVEYQCEIHVDMIFPKSWYEVVEKKMDELEEPMLSPAIINSFSSYSMNKEEKIELPQTVEAMIKLIEGKKDERIIDGLVHPAIHNSYLLKQIGGIDLRFFKGKQGYEDYSMLIGYHNYIGTKHMWKPKIYGGATVFHGVAQQRWTIENPHVEITLNQEGLYNQYGAYGIKALEYMVDDPEYMGELYRNKVKDFMNTQFTFDFDKK